MCSHLCIDGKQLFCVVCGFSLQQFIFITQKCLTMQDTINPDFKLADNFTHTVNFGKVYLITINFLVDVTTSLNYLNFLRAKVNGLFCF